MLFICMRCTAYLTNASHGCNPVFAGDLLDSTTVRQNDIVGGANLTLTVWSLWSSLIQAVVSNDIEEVTKYTFLLYLKHANLECM